jgi:hypothetical protein
MNLPELIPYLRTLESAVKLSGELLPNTDFLEIELYMIAEISIKSEIAFFDSEKTPSTIDMEMNNMKYINFFPLQMVQVMVEDYGKIYNEDNSILPIAKNLINYRLNDA